MSENNVNRQLSRKEEKIRSFGFRYSMSRDEYRERVSEALNKAAKGHKFTTDEVEDLVRHLDAVQEEQCEFCGLPPEPLRTTGQPMCCDDAVKKWLEGDEPKDSITEALNRLEYVKDHLLAGVNNDDTLTALGQARAILRSIGR